MSGIDETPRLWGQARPADVLDNFTDRLRPFYAWAIEVDSRHVNSPENEIARGLIQLFHDCEAMVGFVKRYLGDERAKALEAAAARTGGEA